MSDPAANLDTALAGNALPHSPDDLGKLIDGIPEAERDDMRAALAEINGVDPLTGEDIGENFVLETPKGSDPLLEDPSDPAPDPNAADPEPVKKDDPAADAALAAAVTDADPAKEDPEPTIITPDGKGSLPYSVLERARTELAERDARIAELTANPLTAPAKPEPQAEPRVSQREALRETISDLRETHGETLAGVVDQLAGAIDERDQKIDTLTERNNEMVDSLKTGDEASAQRKGLEVQRLIDSNPNLSEWQREANAAAGGDVTKSALKWHLALAHDETLENSPEWAGRPMADRFGEVVRILGGDALESGAPAPSPIQDAKPNGKDPAAALAKSAVSNPTPALPASLDDLPAGTPVKSLLEQVEGMSSTEMQQWVSDNPDLSSEQLEALLQQVA